MNDLTNSRRNLLNRMPATSEEREKTNLFVGPLVFEYVRYRSDQGIRKPGPNDIRQYFEHLTSIVFDLFSASLADPTLYVGYSRGKSNFIRGGAYWDRLKDQPIASQTVYLGLIDFLHDRGFIENHKSPKGYGGFSSRTRAKPQLLELLKKQELNWASIRTDTSISAIVVKDEHKKPIAPPRDPTFDLARAEANLRCINENLQSSLLNLNITDKEYEALRVQYAHVNDEDEEADYGGESGRESLDFANRSLKRVFALSSFDNGGRFYGGWWQGVPSKLRQYIEIEGCVTAEMDFSTIQPRMLYAKADADPPEDAYRVPGWDSDLRPFIKKAFNQLVNSKDNSRNENQWHRFAPNMPPDPLPEGWDLKAKHERARMCRNEFERRTGRPYQDLLRDLKAMHAPIDEFFFSRSWKWLQRLDSDIAEKVMLEMLDQQYTVLPIHDSFIVRRDGERRLLDAMNDAFEEVVGLPANIDVDAPYDIDPAVYQREFLTRVSTPGIRVPFPWKRVINGSVLTDLLENDLSERSGYHLRGAEWVSVWGLSGYE